MHLVGYLKINMSSAFSTDGKHWCGNATLISFYPIPDTYLKEPEIRTSFIFITKFQPQSAATLQCLLEFSAPSNENTDTLTHFVLTFLLLVLRILCHVLHEVSFHFTIRNNPSHISGPKSASPKRI